LTEKSSDGKRCSVAGCERKHYARGLCNAHFQRAREGRSLEEPLRPNRSNGSTLIRDEQGRKQCIACQQWLPVARFSNHGKTRDGLQVRCLSCVSAGTKMNAYGLTPQNIADLMQKQDHKCAICGANISERFFIDHDHSCCASRHKTCGQCVRGLLCGNCNLGLGAFQDDDERMLNAIKYLWRHEHKNGVEDLQKALWYIQREIERLELLAAREQM
jgi:hypothetical protein